MNAHLSYRAHHQAWHNIKNDVFICTGKNTEVEWDKCDDEFRYQDQQADCYDEMAI